MSSSYPPPPPGFGNPPPPPAGASLGKAPAFGWGAVVAGVFGLIALFAPWFTPNVSGNGASQSADTSFHAWNGYIILLIGPLLLIVVGVAWALAVVGRTWGRFGNTANPLRSISLQSLIAGGVAIVLGLLSFLFLHSSYKFKTTSGNLDWSEAEDQLKQAGLTLHNGPQVGLWMIFIGGVISLAVGVYGFIVASKSAPAAPAGFGSAPAYGQPAAFGNQPPAYGNQPPAYGNQPPAYGNQPPAYGNQPPAYGNQPPAYGNQPPAYGNQPPAYGNQPGGTPPPPAAGYGSTPPPPPPPPPPAAGYGSTPPPPPAPPANQPSDFSSQPTQQWGTQPPQPPQQP